MTQTIKRYIISALLAALLLVPFVVPAIVSAQADIEGSLCQGANLSVNPGGECSTATAGAGGTINDIIATVINIFSVVVGVVAVIMIIIGGLKYVTSSGDSSNVTSAKNTILYAIVGLIIVALAQIIVKFVLNRSTGVNT